MQHHSIFYYYIISVIYIWQLHEVAMVTSVQRQVSSGSTEEFSSTICKVLQMMSEAKETEVGKIEIVPGKPVPQESSIDFSKEAVTSFESINVNEVEMTKLHPVKMENNEITSSIQTCNTTTPLNSEIQYIENERQTQAFTKMIDLPNVLEACQTYDLNYQKELFKSRVTLALNSDGYSEHDPTDEDVEFRLACANYIRNYHSNRNQELNRMPGISQCRETEEQANTRRAQNALRMRKYRESLRSQETEEQAAARRAENALRVRNYRKFKRDQPEVAAEYRAQNAQRMRMYRQRLRAVETTEQAAARRARNAMRVKNYRKTKREQEPEICQSLNAHLMRDYRENKAGTGTKTGC